MPKTECKWINALMKAQEALSYEEEQGPITGWPEASKDTLKESLRPFAQQYVMLGGKL